MSSCTMSILGMQNYMLKAGKDIFEKMEMPETIDIDTLKDNILIKSADFETLYSDPDFLSEAVGVWSRKWCRTITKWANALEIEYDPLTNYDRTEEWIEDETNNGTGITATTNNATDSTSSQTTEQTVPYEDGTLITKGQTNNSGSGTSNTTLNSNTTTEDTRNNKRTGRAYGNIGVTTSQQMLESELEIAKFNLIEQITDLFIREFCILVY